MLIKPTSTKNSFYLERQSPFITFPIKHTQELGVSFSSCNFNDSWYQEELYDIEKITRFKGFKKAAIKRKAEYLAGRIIAKSALSKLGIHTKDIPVGQNRSPIWPNGVQGSITHTRHRAICCVALALDGSYLGIDLEEVISDKTCNEIESIVSTKVELEQFSDHFNHQSVLITLIFSAKESLFKALYPYVKIYFDFLDAEIQLFNKNRFSIKLLKNLNANYQAGQVFDGVYFIQNDEIFTLVTDRKISVDSLASLT